VEVEIQTSIKFFAGTHGTDVNFEKALAAAFKKDRGRLTEEHRLRVYFDNWLQYEAFYTENISIANFETILKSQFLRPEQVDLHDDPHDPFRHVQVVTIEVAKIKNKFDRYVINIEVDRSKISDPLTVDLAFPHLYRGGFCVSEGDQRQVVEGLIFEFTKKG